MRFLLLFFVLLMLACQELPKEYQGEEGKKKLERYRKQFLEGVVLVDDKLKDRLPKDQYFLIIAVKNLKEPMPIAVLRVKNPKFPYRFKITGRHKIRADKLIEGDLILSARISKRPVAEAQKGDLVGSATAKAGQRNIKIVIDSEVP